MSFSKQRGIAGAVVAGVLALASLGPAVTGAAAAEGEPSVTIPGNPMSVYIGQNGQCQSSYVLGGVTAGNFFPGGAPYTFSPVADCGFFLAFPKEGAAADPTALQEQTFGFEGIAGPHGLSLYTPVSQSPVTGAGTAESPYTETTTFKVVDSEKNEDALVTETTTYVNGAPQFTSTFTVTNESKVTLYFRAMYAGDLFVNGSDLGTGVYLAGPPRFIGGENTSSGVLGGFQEAPAPALPWSSFQELPYPNVWETVESTVQAPTAFNESIEPQEVDNAAGVEWDQLRTSGLAAGKAQTFTIINRTQVPSGLQISPANQTLTQGQTETVNVTALDTAGQPYAGKSVRYTVSGANPQSGAVTLNGSGQAQISYVGHNAGVDTIQMYVDLGGSGSQTASDPAATAQVTFTPLPPAPNSSYTVQSIKASSNGTITIVFVPTQSGTATLTVTVPTGTIARREALAARHSKKCGKGQSRIKHKCRPTITVSGTVSASGTAGVPLTLTVKPSGKVLAALNKGKAVHLTATLTYKSALGGTPTVNVYSLTVKGKRKHRHGRKH
ncbi:MAG TPA: Ig-like domain-containing protein [Solirubrobacteraceae bacterium]|jgi:hypothetical protein|nr:Ig-like domain-containing protein [Solirubrobacteraceae bacterium]